MAIDTTEWVYNKDDEILITLSYCVNCDNNIGKDVNSIFCPICYTAYKILPDKKELVEIIRNKLFKVDKLNSFTVQDDKIVMYSKEFKFTIDLNTFELFVYFLTEFKVCINS